MAVVYLHWPVSALASSFKQWPEIHVCSDLSSGRGNSAICHEIGAGESTVRMILKKSDQILQADRNLLSASDTTHPTTLLTFPVAEIKI
ncbi:hypothetical protein Pmani_008115 [Petrolisthes manimaculis]|uniref:Uncharacterized protein n=1 Tax=Petrolisthes manimaculis TaxID=1843537 RepID=A0AAE1UJC1_9EUCA|nr:hypothetical protein Pmani_008115 [Petrolisthes manimaculis]